MGIIFNYCNKYLYLPKISNMVTGHKQERSVVHLEIDGHHYYYGNLKALCDSWQKERLGVSYNYLRNYGLNEINPYYGKNCIIRKGILVTSNRAMK